MRLGKFLGSHRLGAVLLTLCGIAVLLGGTLPQLNRLPPDVRQKWQMDGSFWSVWLERLGLLDVFGSVWFSVLVALLAVSLAIGTGVSTFQRWRSWRCRRGGGEGWRLLGLIGVPALHLGALVIVIGGLISMQTGFGAHLELTEGEVYEGGPGKLIMARGKPPERLPGKLRLDQAQIDLEDGHYLRELAAKMTYRVEAGGPVRQARVRSNQPLEIDGYRFFPDNNFGYSAILERRFPDGSRRLMLVNFSVPREAWGGQWQVERAKRIALDGARPASFQMELQGPDEPRFNLETEGRVDYQGSLAPGETADLGPFRLHFRGVAPWVGFYVARDPGEPVAFAGMILALTGFLLHLLFSRGGPSPSQEGSARSGDEPPEGETRPC